MTEIAQLEEIEAELEAAETILVTVSHGVLQASVHLRKAGLLLARLPGATASDFAEIIKLNARASSGLTSTWSKILSYMSYDDASVDTIDSLTDEESYAVLEFQRDLCARHYAELRKGFPVLVRIFQSPVLMLAFALPVLLYAAGFIFFKSANPVKWIYTGLEDFSVEHVSQGWGNLTLNRSVQNNPLVIAKTNYEVGYGTHASSEIRLRFKKKASRFTGACGLDDETNGKGTIQCKVMHGDQVLFESDKIWSKMQAKNFSIDVTGLDQVTLLVTDAGDGKDNDHADWVDLKLE